MSEQNKNSHALDLSGLSGDGALYLGDPSVVAELLTGLAEGHIDNMVLFSDGGLKRDEFEAKTLEACRALARVFLGQDDEYRPRKFWNAHGFIDKWIGAAVGSEEQDPTERLSSVLAVYLTDVQAAVQEFDARGVQSDYETKVTGQTEYFTKLFLGLNPEAGDGEDE